MTDREFDQLLYQGANELPPGDGPCSRATPWRTALRLICWGFLLNFFTIQFFNLQYILPTVGVVLVFLGFRSLRRENGWLRLSYRLSVLLAAAQFILDILLATPLFSLLSDDVSLLLGLALSFVVWVLQFALWRGLKAVFRKAEQPPKTRAAGGLVIWCGIVLLVALLGENGGYIAFFVLVVWILMLWELFKISRCLDQAGYAIEPAPVRFSGGRIMLVSLLSLAAIVAACLLLFSRYPLDAASAELGAGQEALRAELVELGFPEEVLADLTDEEVANLERAYKVNRQNSSPLHYGSDGYEDIDLPLFYYIQLQLPDDRAQYFFWCSWTQPPERRFRDGIEVTPTYHYDTLYLISPIQGRLLWEKDGQTLQSPLSGDYSTLTQSSVIWGDQTYQGASVNFSLPAGGEHIRGYISYTARIMNPTKPQIFNAAVRYIHQDFPVSYPWKSPCQYQPEVSRNDDLFFPARQHLVMFSFEGRSDPE